MHQRTLRLKIPFAAILVLTLMMISFINPVFAASSVSCSGNNLYISTGMQATWGSVEVRGDSGPGIPVAIDWNGNATLTGPASWVNLKLYRWDGVYWTAIETLGSFTCPPPPTPPSITGQPGGSTITHNQTATMSVTATGATSYQWYQGTSGTETNPIGGANGSSYTTPALAASGSPYNYWVKVTNANGSTNSNTATITVNKANTTTWRS